MRALVVSSAVWVSTPAWGGELVNVSVDFDGWTMTPIAEAGVVRRIIATRNDDEALATDIDVVLYTRASSGWSGEAYDPSMTKEDAVVDLAQELGLPDPFAGAWHISLDADDVLEHVLPRVEFGKGFFVTDPLYLIAQAMQDPEPLVEQAEDQGMPAGGGSINTGATTSPGGAQGPGDVPIVDGDGCGCTDACLQDAILEAAQALLDDDADGVETLLAEDLHAVFSTGLADRGGCACNGGIVHGRLRTPTSWTCGFWFLVDTTPIGGGGTQCSYERTLTKLQTQRCVIVCEDSPNCPSFVFTRTRLLTAKEFGSSIAASGAACSPPAAGVCGPPTTGVETGPWVGSPPDCP